MVLFPYGGYSYGCAMIPSLAACNLFYKQILETQPESTWANLLGTSTGVGVDPMCAIAQVGDNSVGNVALIAAGGISTFIALGLAIAAGKRQAAVGRAEMEILFLFYGVCCVLQLLDCGDFLTNGTTALTWITGIHTGFVVGVFWCLAWLAFLSLQVVEDGTWQSILPFFVGLIILVVGSAYIALDTAFSVSGYFNTNPTDLRNAWLWSLTFVWPPVAAFFYLVVNVAVVTTVLRERKPVFLFLATAIVFALGQGARFALSYRICIGTNARIDGSFVAVILETLSAILLYFSWKSITEDSWSPDDYADFGVETQGRTAEPTMEERSHLASEAPYDDYARDHDSDYPPSTQAHSAMYEQPMTYARQPGPASVSNYSRHSEVY